MRPIAVLIPYSPEPFFEKTVFSLRNPGLIEQVLVLTQERIDVHPRGCRVLVGGPLSSHETLRSILGEIQTKYFLLIPDAQPISIEPKAMERMVEAGESTKAGLVYSDFYNENDQGKRLHPLNDCQFGSVRDDFDFGAMILLSVDAVRKALKEYGAVPEVKFAGLYDLRLKLSIGHAIPHVPEPFYSVIRKAGAIHEFPPYEKIFG